MLMHDYLIDEITALRHENRLLREEVEARRAAAADLMRAMAVPVAEPCRLEQLRPRESSSQAGTRAPAPEAGERQRASESDRMESAISLLVDQIARTTDVLTPPDITPLVSQLAHLNGELTLLREEIRTLHRRQTMSLLGVRDSRGEQSGARIHPLRTNGPDIIIESTDDSRLWQRLRQPRIYPLLVWGTIIIVAVLVFLLVFLD